MADRKTEFWDIESLSELRRRFQKPGWALRLFEWLRWPDGRFCPDCGSLDHLPIEGRQKTGLYHCRDCRKQFSATSGTPLHKTKLPIETWMEAAFLIASSSKGVSSVILATQLGVQQKTAWKIGHAIRLMMRPPADEPKLSGVVEVDDMTLGEDPKRTNRRKYGAKLAKHIYNPPGRGSKKGRILVAAERGGRVRARPMRDAKKATVQPMVKEMATQAASLMTDRDQTLGAVGQGFASHQSVNHSAGEYVRGEAHVNTVEAFHLYTQRAKFGVWHRWSENHQQRYLDELAFHWDHRPRFQKLDGKRHRIVRSAPIILRMQQIFRNAGGRRLTRVGASVSDTGHKM
jgi:hypothetical protein